MDNLLQRIEKYNKIMEKYEKTHDKKDKSYKIIYGEIPILISAPHSVRQLRNGKIKKTDLYTGPIVLEIANKTKCYAIYKTYNNNDDANYNIQHNEYKKEVLKIIKEKNIKLFLDIHGAADTEEFEIDIGTDNLKSLKGQREILEKFIQICDKKGIYKIGIGKKFKADTLHTITKTISSKTEIPAMQIEITKKYRDLNQIENMKKIIEYIKELITEFK